MDIDLAVVGMSAFCDQTPKQVGPIGTPLFNKPEALNDNQTVPFHMSSELVSLLYISNPVAGELMAFRSAVVILGISSPLLFELISTFADGSGVAVPTPTFCAKTGTVKNSQLIHAIKCFMRGSLSRVKFPVLWLPVFAWLFGGGIHCAVNRVEGVGDGRSWGLEVEPYDRKFLKGFKSQN